MSIFSGFHKKEEKKEKAEKAEKKEEKIIKKTSQKTTLAKEKKPTASAKTKTSMKSGKKEETLNYAVASKIKKTERPALTFHFPHISEKATRLEEEEGKYVFRVNRRTNKVEIKKAFEEMHRVKVASVRIVNIPRKKRDWRGKAGYRPGYKKAIIKLAKGQKVNIH